MGNKDLLGLSMSKSRRKPVIKFKLEWADTVFILMLIFMGLALWLM